MADSIKGTGVDHSKRIHSGSLTGHLRKGPGSMITNASIPSKYQTVATDNSDKKGFLSQAKRFNPRHVDEIPAPCQYMYHGKFDTYSPSFSMRGTGGMASKVKRDIQHTFSSAPGPGIYSLPSTLTSRNDFNRKAVTGIFAAPVAEHEARPDTIPAPNIYNVLKARTGRVNNVTADAAFKSKSKRELMNLMEQSKIPAPDQYHIKEDLTCKTVKVPFSSFRSQSKREIMAKPQAFPGPGHYRPNEEVQPANRMIFPRRHYLCIAAPAIPLPESPPLPGPGSYEMVNYEGPPKNYMSGSVFVSTTNRRMGDVARSVSELPGPASYRPVTQGKQSFIYNAAGRWL